MVTREARQAKRLQGVASLRTESLQGRNQRHVAGPFCAGGALKASPVGDHAFICGIRGKPLTKESFRNLFRKAVRATGIEGKSAPVFALHQSTNCARLSKQVIGKLANETETSIPSPMRR